ncbi:MAG: hypothetical protein ACM3U1_06500 [Chloroflexota bacterium]
MLKSIYKAAVLLALAAAPAAGQSLELRRTDIAPRYSGSVTATRNFGVDVLARDVRGANGVFFELRYAPTEYISFAGWTLSDEAKSKLGQKSEAYALETRDAATGEAVLIVGVGSGAPLPDSSQADSLGWIDPMVIHLDFNVAAWAEHNTKADFRFTRPVAATSAGVIDLAAEPVSYNINGFVDVWPGDADNDGETNHLDWSQIMLYLGSGESAPQMRAYRRRSPSLNFIAQKALAWDDPAATYADCDGNGEVTMSDMLVVVYNMKKSWKPASIVRSKEVDHNDGSLLGADMYLPIEISSDQNFLGVAARLDVSEILENYEIVGVARGDLFFGSSGKLDYKLDAARGELYVVAGEEDGLYCAKRAGTLTRLALRKKPGSSETPAPRALTLEAKAISGSGYVFDIAPAFLSLDDAEASELAAELRGEELTISAAERYSNVAIEVYSSEGSRRISAQVPLAAGKGLFSLEGLPQGVWFAKLTAGRNSKFIKLIKLY